MVARPAAITPEPVPARRATAEGASARRVEAAGTPSGYRPVLSPTSFAGRPALPTTPRLWWQDGADAPSAVDSGVL